MVRDGEADRVGVVADRVAVAEKVRGAADKVKVADNVGAAWAVPLQQVLPASASVRNAGIANRTSAEYHAHRSSVRSAELP
ncbi:MAG TPA: hypothetical protein VLT13_11840 [Bacteroidota bacterium]|nr:hypothetical protein [Bacteroidota bacterium]